MSLVALNEVLVVAAGGALGAVLRYQLAGWVERAIKGSGFPGGTLAVNALGCLALGVLLGLAEHRWQLSHERRLFLVIGILGSLTTFSTFGFETVELLREGKHGFALASVAANLVLGIGGAAAGFFLAARVGAS